MTAPVTSSTPIPTTAAAAASTTAKYPVDAEPGNDGIAVMCDIARVSGLDLTAEKRTVIARLIDQGLVAEQPPKVDTGMPSYRITPQGQALLDDRGVGVNES